MIPRKKRLKSVGTINETFHSRCNSKLEYKIWKQVMKECLLEACKEILENQTGYNLPNDMGKIIILQAPPYKHIDKLYSVTNNGECTEIFNFHSFGMVGSFNWKDVPKHNLIKIFKFSPNRNTLKIPLYHIFHAGIANYINKEEYKKYE